VATTAGDAGTTTTTAPPEAAPDPLTATRTLTYQGVDRSYRIHVPAGLPPGEEVPLVVGLHGGLGSGQQFEEANHVDEVADEGGFIAVYPDGTTNDQGMYRTWNGGYCCGPAALTQVDDVGFIRALVGEVESEYPIDTDRVYAMGHSNGGIMSYRLGCQAADVFAAVGVVAGSMGGYDCQPSEPVSVVHIHGDADQNHPINGGNGENSLTIVEFNSAYDTVDQWVALDGCDAEPTVETKGDDPDNPYDESTWSCPDGVSVVFDVIPGGPHSWPGGTTVIPQITGQPSTAMDATRRIWEFLDAHGR